MNKSRLIAAAAIAAAVVFLMTPSTGGRDKTMTLDASHFGEKHVSEKGLEVATLAGGCFWGMEDLIRKIPGVLETRVGYTGGSLKNAAYTDVKTGMTGHAESVEILFDPKQVSFEKILLFFFRAHDPTTENRQGNDRGSQYRSAIFYHGDSQRKVADEVKARVDRSGKWGKPVVTQIVPAGEFWQGEEYHQKYLIKHPDGYTCHFIRDFSFD